MLWFGSNCVTANFPLTIFEMDNKVILQFIIIIIIIVSVKPSPPTESRVELADISLEQDKTELDAFLQSDTDTGKYM